MFGEPFEKNGVTVIPAAKVMGGGGGGSGESLEGTGQGSGSGFGIGPKPAGANVIRDDDVGWQSAVDVNRLIVGALALTALAMILGFRRSRVGTRPRHEDPFRAGRMALVRRRSAGDDDGRHKQPSRRKDH